VRLGWRFNGVTVGANFDFGLGVGAFAFVSFGDFCSHDLHRRCLPPARVATVYKQTTIVNNYVVNNTRIINRGVAVDRVAAASRTAVPRATVRDLPAGATRGPDRSGAFVYRHQLAAPARPVNMVAEKVDPRHPVIQHAPVVPVRAEQSRSFGRSGSAPGVAAARHQATEEPKVPPRSSSARPETKVEPPGSAARSSEGRPEAARSSWAPAGTSRAVPTVPPAPEVPKAPAEWKQGTRSAPGYRSDAGLPALNNTRTSAQSPSAAAPTFAGGRQAQTYYPKAYNQPAEISSRSQSGQPQSSPAPEAKSPGARSKKNR